MLKIIGTVLIACFALCGSTIGQQRELFTKVNKIERLFTDREQMIQAFGQPQKGGSRYFEEFRMPGGQVDVEYSRGPCLGDKGKGWNVKEFTVTRLFLSFDRKTLTSTLGLNPNKFKKDPSKDVAKAYSLVNEISGMNIDINPNGTIEMIEFYPPEKNDNLLCK